MTGFENGQDAFVAALRDPTRTLPAGISKNTASRRRFNVYRNNVYAGLISVLEARYPAVQRIVGDEFFRAMARVFVDRSPPRSPVLLDYGAGFSEFVASFEPVADVPYLTCVASLEWKMHIARHAADSGAIPVGDLAAYGETATELKVRLAPAVSLLVSDFPVFALWRANTIDPAATGPITVSGAESVLVSRPFLAPEAVRIPRACAVFIAALLNDETLGAATTRALDVQPDFPLNRALALLVAQKAIVSLLPPHTEYEDILP
jgi:hypothetical protein